MKALNFPFPGQQSNCSILFRTFFYNILGPNKKTISEIICVLVSSKLFRFYLKNSLRYLKTSSGFEFCSAKSLTITNILKVEKQTKKQKQLQYSLMSK